MKLLLFIVVAVSACLAYTSGASVVKSYLLREALPVMPVNNDRDVVKPRDIPVNCMWCEFAVDTLRKNFLPNVKSEKQLINMTTTLCLEFLKNKTECALIGPLVGHVLWTEKSSSTRQICSQVKFCPAPIYSSSAGQIFQLLQKELPKVIKPDTDIPVNCMWCELAVNFLDKNVLQDITSEDMLANNITSLCKQFLPNNQSMCDLFAPLVAQYIWQAKTDSPKAACAMIGMCPATVSKSNGLAIRNGTECTICKGLVDVLKTAVLGNIQLVENEVISIFCDHLPPTPMKSCTAAIKADLPGDIEKYMNPDTLCALAKLCS